ncbi:helix-turn-helix domain-containing protein [Oxalobacter sp. OttesenSCG-928-P03]|nr:helix-turn-helix domain-containing protein [Oxalobacter sp. OttesenSCG-928-P03]
METKQASVLFEALSSDIRLDVFRLLVKNAPGGLVAGEIARQLDIPSTNLSFHLKAIMHAGLISMEKEGRYLRYRANIPLMLDMIGYLTEECCAGSPETCQMLRNESTVSPLIFAGRKGKNES